VVFHYQTTDPATNAPVGQPDSPVNISAGGLQTFVVSLTPTGTQQPTQVSFGFSCTTAGTAPNILGVSTLLFSASSTPVPDIVALAASGDPGYVDIPGATGTGDFAVASVNLGSGDAITATASTGTTNLPVTLAICQTNAASGVCVAAPAASVSTTINTGDTPTFGIFVTGLGAIPVDPANHRIFVQFTDSNGNVRGETSVAVRTQ
jgi:hypothetical protein